MVLPDSLGILLAPVQLRRNQHGKPDEILQKKYHSGNDAKVGMNGVKVWVVTLHFVVFDDGHAGDERKEGY